MFQITNNKYVLMWFILKEQKETSVGFESILSDWKALDDHFNPLQNSSFSRVVDARKLCKDIYNGIAFGHCM